MGISGAWWVVVAIGTAIIGSSMIGSTVSVYTRENAGIQTLWRGLSLEEQARLFDEPASQIDVPDYGVLPPGVVDAPNPDTNPDIDGDGTLNEADEDPLDRTIGGVTRPPTVTPPPVIPPAASVVIFEYLTKQVRHLLFRLALLLLQPESELRKNNRLLTIKLEIHFSS